MTSHPDTPEPVVSDEPLLPPDEEAPLASPWKRWLARSLDGALVLLSPVPGFLLMVVTEDGPLYYLGVLLVLSGVIGYVAYQLVLLTREGQTVAKRLFLLRIVDYEEGTIPGFARAVLVREVLTAVLSAIPLFSLVDALFIFGAEHRCLHDYLAGTAVVDESEVVATDAVLI